MAAGRAYAKDESVTAAMDCPLGDGTTLQKGTAGTVTQNSSETSATVRVKWSGVAGRFKVIPKSYVSP